MQQFFDIVFALVYTHRDQLSYSPTEYEGHAFVRTNAHLSGIQRLSFRSLLFSAFKPHGGATVDDYLFKQHVVYTDITREPASDILSVPRMLDLLQSIVRPRTAGSPRFIVVPGDQPS